MMNNEVVSQITQKEILLLSEGSVAVFEKVYRLYSGKLYSFVMKISNSNAYISEEILQITFMKLWESRQSIDVSKNLFSYLCTIAKNTLLNNYKHETIAFVYKEYVLKEHSELDFSTEKEVENNILQEYIDSIVEKLPPARKQIFTLSSKMEMTNSQIAEQLHISVGTVEKALSAARIFIRKEIANHYDKVFTLLLLLFNS